MPQVAIVRADLRVIFFWGGGFAKKLNFRLENPHPLLPGRICPSSLTSLPVPSDPFIWHGMYCPAPFLPTVDALIWESRGGMNLTGVPTPAA